MRAARRGGAAVEFALCLPVFVLVLAGIVDLSQFVATLQLAQRAARDGARIGSTVIEGSDATGDDIEAAAESQCRLMLEAGGLPCGAGCDVSAEWVEIEDVMYVRVLVVYPYDPTVGLARFLSDDVTAQFVMMTQQQ